MHTRTKRARVHTKIFIIHFVSCNKYFIIGNKSKILGTQDKNNTYLIRVGIKFKVLKVPKSCKLVRYKYINK